MCRKGLRGIESLRCSALDNVVLPEQEVPLSKTIQGPGLLSSVNLVVRDDLACAGPAEAERTHGWLDNWRWLIVWRYRHTGVYIAFLTIACSMTTLSKTLA